MDRIGGAIDTCHSRASRETRRTVVATLPFTRSRRLSFALDGFAERGVGRNELNLLYSKYVRVGGCGCEKQGLQLRVVCTCVQLYTCVYLEHHLHSEAVNTRQQTFAHCSSTAPLWRGTAKVWVWFRRFYRRFYRTTVITVNLKSMPPIASVFVTARKFTLHSAVISKTNCYRYVK